MIVWKSSLALAIFFCVGQTLVSAQTAIPIANSSFELPHDDASFTQDPVNGDFSNSVSGWSGTGSFGVYAPTPGPYPGGVPDGTQVGFINDTGSIYQDVSANLTAGTTYTLSGYVGQRTDYSNTPGSINLETVDGTVLASSGLVQATSGGFKFTSFTFTALATDTHLGQGLRVSLNEDGIGQANFDAISLTTSASATPEPGSIGLFVAGGLTYVGLIRRRKAHKSA